MVAPVILGARALAALKKGKSPELLLQPNVTANFAQVGKRLKKVITSTIPFAQSRSLNAAAHEGRRAYAKTIDVSFKDPIPIFIGDKRRDKKTRNTRARPLWIQFDTKKDIQKQRGNGGAKVWLEGVGNSFDKERQQETFHRHAKGTTEHKVPHGTPFIVSPSKKLKREKSIKGTPIKIDRYGNFVNYNKRVRQEIKKDTKRKYLEIKIGEPSTGGRFGNGLKLSPGLYLLTYRKRKYTGKRHPITKRKRGPYNINGNSGKKREVVKITTILNYYPIRTFKKTWDFKPDVIRAMAKEYDRVFLDFLNDALRDIKPDTPSGQRRVGRL